MKLRIIFKVSLDPNLVNIGYVDKLLDIDNLEHERITHLKEHPKHHQNGQQPFHARMIA